MFIVCGEALFDVFMADGIAMDAVQVPFNARVGGSPFNVAIGLARLGQPVAMLTGISTDFLGERLLTVLKAENVTTDLIARKDAPTTLGFVQHAADGVPSYAFYGNGAADRLLTLDDIEVDLSAASGIHLGSYSIVVQPTADTYLELVRRQAGKRLISLDPNIRLNVEPNLDIWRARVTELLPLTDIVKVSDEDLHSLYPGVEPEAIVADWLAMGVKLLVLTRGGSGASLWSAQARVDVTAPNIKVIDTVGAGDTFQASLLDALVKLQAEHAADWAQALTAQTLQAIGQFAASAAAITCSRRGADLPTRAELLASLAQSST